MLFKVKLIGLFYLISNVKYLFSIVEADAEASLFAENLNLDALGNLQPTLTQAASELSPYGLPNDFCNWLSD